ncbi:Uncharacterised protein [Mycobacterium tuberculosis]|nr:Uncharacterised protein [Mycobacterium tuberculosis]
MEPIGGCLFFGQGGEQPVEVSVDLGQLVKCGQRIGGSARAIEGPGRRIAGCDQVTGAPGLGLLRLL